jgi:hypothetical protein
VPVKMVKKPKGPDSKLKEMIDRLRAEGKPEHFIEGAVRGWMRAVAQDKKNREKGV